MADKRDDLRQTRGGSRNPLGSDPGADRPDLEGVRATREDPGYLPVPRSVLESKGIKPPPNEGSPFDVERGLLPGARRPIRAAGRGTALPRTSGANAEEALLRSTSPRAARTPEELGRALSHLGDTGVRDPQRGREGGPPLPGEPGYGGKS